MGILWESMKFLWIFFDGSMIFLWCFYWVPVGFPWYFYGFLVDPCVISMGSPWWFFGISLGFQRGVYEVSIRFLSDFYGIPMFSLNIFSMEKCS